MTLADTLYTLWRFTSVSTGESRAVWRDGHPSDLDCQHEYQQVLWHGYAFNISEAMCKAGLALGEQVSR